MTAWLGLAAALVQGVAVLIAARVLWRRRERHLVLGGIFTALGSLILAANAARLATGGPGGRSPIGMRGGMFGFWLSMLTAVEIIALGAIALTRRVRRPGARSLG